MNFSIVKHEDEVSITVLYQGKTYTATDSHPSFEKIKEILLAQAFEDVDEQNILDLFNPTKKFERLSERVSVAYGRVYFDGDEINTPITQHITRTLEAGGDVSAHVNFLEKLQQNPNEHSRNELWLWLESNDFTLTSDGDIVAYKGVRQDGFSINSGRATVDGQEVTGRIPNQPGSVIEMPRSEVVHDPKQACHVGLHVAHFDFAKIFGDGLTYEVHINPRDVVSVPSYDGDKMRVCRYRVIKAVDETIQEPVVEGEENKCPCGCDDVVCCECGGDCETCTCDEDEGRHPDQRELDSLKDLAKKRKRGFVRTAKQHGWELDNEDAPDDPNSWTIFD